MLSLLQSRLKNIPKTVMSAFFCSLIFGFLAHYFVITTKLTNSDDIRQTCDTLRDIKYGRWLQTYASAVTGNLSMPFNCLLALIYIGIAAAVTALALRLHSRVTAGILGALMATFPTLTFSNLFNSTADAYAAAVILMALGGYSAVRVKNKLLSTLLSVIFITASLGIYQAFLGLALGIMILSGISALAFEEASFKEVFFDELRYLLITGASVGIYMAIARGVMTATGTKAYDYQNINKMGQVDISALPEALRHTYTKSIGFYVLNSRGVHYGWLTVLLSLMAAAALIFFVVYLIRARRGGLETALSLVLLFLLPMAAGIIYVMGAENYHLLMTYGFVVLLFFPILLTDRAELSAVSGRPLGGVTLPKKLFQAAVLAVVGLTVFNYITIANKVYMVDYFVYEESYSYAQTVASVIRTTPGFGPDTTIYMAGEPVCPAIAIDEFYEDDPRLEDFGHSGLDRDFTSEFSFESFFWYYLGLTNTIELIDEEEAEELCGRSLSVFPEEGCLYSTDDIIVMRFK